MKRLLRLTLVAAVLAAGLPYAIAAWQELPVDDEFRQLAPGEFVQLRDGQVHYQWVGPASGEVVVLVHGVSVPQYVFAQASDALAQAGYRVLLFDLLGHGFSDRPDAPYDADFFTRQILELLDRLGLDEPVNVGALSMGGVIAADFTSRYPQRVKSLTLFAPAGLRLVNDTDSTFVSLLKSPVIGNWMWRMLGRRIYFPEREDDYVDPAFEPGSEEILHGEPEHQADYEGYLMAMRQIFRNLRLSHRDDLFAQIGASGVPVLGIFGSSDATIHLQSAAILQELVPHARVEILDGATHHLSIHRWKEIHELMASFFQTNRGGSAELRRFTAPAPSVPVSSGSGRPGYLLRRTGS